MNYTSKNDSVNDLSEDQILEFLDFAEFMIVITRKILLRHINLGFERSVKSDRSVVTSADIEVERYVRAAVDESYPEHGVIGEEFGVHLADAPFTWTIDPIDGTLSFVHGVPLYSTFLALLYHGEPVVGIIDVPGLEWFYSGGRGVGAWKDGTELRFTDTVSEQDIEHEILALGERRQFVDIGKAKLFDSAMKSHRHVRTYCDGFGHGMTLEGSLGGMIDVGLKIWDVAATKLLVAEAGGSFVEFDRGLTSEGQQRFDVVFGKPDVVQWLMTTLNLESDT